VIVPQYVEDSALKWAQVLATPVATVAGLGIQASVAKNASDNAARVQLANFQSNENIQLGQQQMLVDSLAVSGAGTQAAVGGLVDLGVAGFDALNIAGEQTADVATVGLGTADSIATSGFTTADSIATTGFATADNALSSLETVSLGSQTSLVTLGTAGLNATETVSLGAQTSLVTLGGAGLDTANSLGTAGLSTAETIGLSGMTALNELGQAGLDSLNTMNTTNSTLVQGITTDYNQILQDYNATMQAISTDNPDVCVVDPATGTSTCN